MLKLLDKESCVHIEAADSTMDVSHEGQSMLRVEAHRGKLTATVRPFIDLNDVVEVHSESAILAIVDSKTVFAQNEEVLVRLEEEHIDRRVDHSVSLLVSCLLDLRDAFFSKDNPSDFKFFLRKSSLCGLVLVAVLQSVVEGNMLG